MNYKLQKYTGINSRHTCPSCNKPRCFVQYIDEEGNPIHPTVGRCNHESSCAYHHTPREWFATHPTLSPTIAPTAQRTPPPPPRPVGNIPFDYVHRSLSYNSGFVHFLCSILDRQTLESPTIERLMSDYLLGATKEGATIFWQIDRLGKARTGKVIKYNPTTGHRLKEGGAVDWVHAIMKRQNLLTDNYNLQQCLFGEHLLTTYPHKTVALVESEKSALIGSSQYPQYIWLATGGKSQLAYEKMKVLKGRTVVIYPDVDAYSEWCEAAKAFTFCKCTVANLLEQNATTQEREQKIDLADWLIEKLSSETPQTTLEEMRQRNPAIDLLIERFDLTLVE